jgi:hypothetical protein
MAYREGEFRDLCTQCNETSSTTCLRCGDPLCAAHAPDSDDRRCFVCEALYLGRETSQVKTAMVSLVVLGAVLGFCGAVGLHLARNGFITGPGAHMTPLVLFGAIGLLAAGFGLAPVMRSLARRRFLGERHGRARAHTRT